MAHGFDTPPNNRGEDMPREYKRVFEREQRELGDRLILESEKYAGGFIEKFGGAARALGYTLYTDVPKGTRQYIQYALKKKAEIDEATEGQIDQMVGQARGYITSPTQETVEWHKSVDIDRLPPEDRVQYLKSLDDIAQEKEAIRLAKEQEKQKDSERKDN
jgi:hypothetical protein